MSVVVFVFVNYLPFNMIAKLFLIGFIKHFFGYLSGIQSFYCNLYLSDNENNKYEVKSSSIIIESLLEGFMYVSIGFLLFKMIKNNYLVIFSLGFCIHIIADIFGIHDLFLKNNCHIQNKK